jgi:hypothetical protein
VTVGNKPHGGNRLLWIGLAMIAASLVLALALSLYAARLAGSLSPQAGPQGGVAREGADDLTAARKAAEGSLQGYGNPNLEVVEVMEFANNYYAEVREKDTGIGAMELLVDKNTGAAYPEPGPNMMWNTKYGMMSGGSGDRGPMMGGGGRMMGPGGQEGMMGRNGPGVMQGGGPSSGQAPQEDATPSDEMPVNAERATEIADDYLSRVSPGTRAGESERFYGYYTLHTEKGGEITGMLSVNGYSGEVWYHSWHGPFIAMKGED